MGRLCFFGTFDPDAPRVKRLMAGWQALGGEVSTVHVPMWPEAGDRAALPTQGGLVRWVWRWLRAQRALSRRRREVAQADAILVPYPGHFDVALAKRFGKPVVFDPFLSLWDTAVGDRALVTGPKAEALKAIDQWALRLADGVLADTPAMAAFYAQLAGLPASRLHVVPVGADESLFHPLAPTPEAAGAIPLPSGERTGRRPGEGGPHPGDVLFYGRMIPLHGLDTILKAAKLLEPDGIPFHLIGEGQVDLQRHPHPSNVRWTPGVPYEDLPGLVAAAAVCLGLFGTSDKAARVVPHKVYEAAAMAKAIVSADTPAMREAFDGAIALVPPGDPAALADALRALWADPARREALGQAAYIRFTEAFSTRAVGEALARALAPLGVTP